MGNAGCENGKTAGPPRAAAKPGQRCCVSNQRRRKAELKRRNRTVRQRRRRRNLQQRRPLGAGRGSPPIPSQRARQNPAKVTGQPIYQPLCDAPNFSRLRSTNRRRHGRLISAKRRRHRQNRQNSLFAGHHSELIILPRPTVASSLRNDRGVSIAAIAWAFDPSPGTPGEGMPFNIIIVHRTWPAVSCKIKE